MDENLNAHVYTAVKTKTVIVVYCCYCVSKHSLEVFNVWSSFSLQHCWVCDVCVMQTCKWIKIIRNYVEFKWITAFSLSTFCFRLLLAHTFIITMREHNNNWIAQTISSSPLRTVLTEWNEMHVTCKEKILTLLEICLDWTFVERNGSVFPTQR